MPSRSVGPLIPANLAWPDESDAASDSLEANHQYMADARLARWEDVDSVLEREREVLPLLADAENPELEWESQSERISAGSTSVADDFFSALDPGIASTVLALGAAGCTPFWSCNGGAYGGDHLSPVPIVRFFAKNEHVAALTVAAKTSGVELHQDEHGRCEVSADTLDVVRTFALALRSALGPN